MYKFFLFITYFFHQLSLVENKPEAPWIRRTKEGIIFTEKIDHFENLQLISELTDRNWAEEEEEEHEEGGGMGKKGGRRKEGGVKREEEGGGRREDDEKERMEGRRILEELKLDGAVEEKLKKILNKGKE